MSKFEVIIIRVDLLFVTGSIIVDYKTMELKMIETIERTYIR